MKRKTLSTVVSEALLARIRSGALAPGAQVPTEAVLCEEFEVSRTVVREAIARLRAEGLLIPRQGKGVFVSEAPAASFSIPDGALRNLGDTIALLELRLALETEAAGHAAARRSPAEAVAIRRVMEELDGLHPDPDAVQLHYDYDFHLAIARASGSAYIAGFLVYLQPILVPRFRLGYLVAAEMKERYFDRIHAEHEAIVVAIERQDEAGARRAMRDHLQSSLERLKALARAHGDAQDVGGKGGAVADEAQGLLAGLDTLTPGSAQG